LRRAGNLSRRHQSNTRKILKSKNRTDTQYDNTARFGGQRYGKLKIATWNVRGIVEKTEELRKELMKRKFDIVILTETKKKTKNQKTLDSIMV
jgi:hypothetical protein